MPGEPDEMLPGRRTQSRRIVGARGGFTLIELLVGVALTAALLVFTITIVVPQISLYNARRVARDLTAIKTAFEEFKVNTRRQPQYITHLANEITTADSTIALRRYTAAEAVRWAGPYLTQQVDSIVRSTTDIAWESGYDSQVGNTFQCINRLTGSIAACGTGMYVAVQVNGLTGADFEEVNRLIDLGEVEGRGVGKSRRSGRLLFLFDFGIDPQLSVGVLYYLITPYNP